MRCDQAREALSTARYQPGGPDATTRAHVDECAGCREFAARFPTLDHVLEVDVAIEPRPGFDTRFFARLDDVRTPRRTRRPLAWILGAAGASTVGLAVVGLVLLSRPEAPAPRDDLALAADLDLVEDLEMLRRLDEVEAFALLSRLDPTELEALDRGEVR